MDPEQGGTAPDAGHSAWNPGLDSELPRAYLPLATVFRADNVSTGLATARELADYCGLPMQEIVAFRPERLIVHELLIRITASVSVPDGSDYEDLGRNFREIATTVLDTHIAPHRGELVQAFADVRQAASTFIARELAQHFAAPPPSPPPAKAWRWFGARQPGPPPAPAETPEARDQRVMADWARRAQSAPTRLEQACLAALSRIASAIAARQGRLFANNRVLAELALTQVGNEHGSEVIGDALAPLIAAAVVREGYRPLSPQDSPVVMNVKGASASGKSTMRPLQRILARKLGFPWQDFALISPDIWRKFLLDYASLGPAYKYAGTLTGHEIEIVDKKLDRHMAAKAARGEMPHLLIDRFRFDSFTALADGHEPTRLLTRFGDLVYMFFMITPPEMTVERAWIRGQKVGRYKAVEDLLAHNVEAYTGMPELFFTWALDTSRRIHYEFLDNSVAEGEPPRTVAFGWNGEMTILDVKTLIDIDRFRRINIHAANAGEVYAGRDLAPQHHVEFLKRCARLIPAINFAARDSGCVYARLEHGRWTWRDAAAFARALDDAETRAALSAIASDPGADPGAAPPPRDLVRDVADAKRHTLGAWGEGG